MKRVVSIVSCVVLASAIAAGCDKGAKAPEAAAKPAEGDKAAPAAPAAGEPTATAPAQAPVDPAAAGAAGVPGMAPPAAVAVVEPTADEKVLAEKSIKMVEDMAAVAEKNLADCGKAATALQAVVDKNKDVIEAGRKMDDPGKKAWFEQNYQGRMMGAMGKMMPLMEKCKDDPKVLAVFQSME